jgi:hypothetical protein
MLKAARCPFCGKEPFVLPVDPETEGGAWGEVICKQSDHCISIRDGEDIADDQGSEVYRETAIIRWNSMFLND